jgi:SOS-response transcriptional repressor LexA
VVIDFIGNHRSFLNKQEVLGLQDLPSSPSQDSTPTSPPELGDGCYITIDPEVIEFWQELSKQLRNSSSQEFVHLMNHLGHRPRAVEFYRAGYDFNKVNKQHGSWHELLAEQDCEHDIQAVIHEHKTFLLEAVQKMSMTKSFKAILLEAFLELDGFQTPPTLQTLATKSGQVLARYPSIREADLPSKQQMVDADSTTWLQYWKSNPINAFIGGNRKNATPWFVVEDGCFKNNFLVESSHIDILGDLVKELVDLQLARYADRRKNTETVLESEQTLATVIQLPYYPNLKIACGHFKTGTHDELELMEVDLPNLDPQKHFLARASGNSMNGGKSPILDGQLLLLELVTSVSAGSITGNTMAIEIQDQSGDNQYLLRVVQKDGSGNYWLKANNPDYDVIRANDSMRTFARLKQVIEES